MFKPFYDLFKITERQLSIGAILRLRVAAILSIFAGPAYVAGQIFSLSSIWQSVFLWISVIGVIGLFGAYSTRVCNRLWVPEIYLDEDEVFRRRAASSFAFYWVITAMLVMSLIYLIAGLPTGHVRADVNIIDCVALYTIAMTNVAMSLQLIYLSWILKPIDPDNIIRGIIYITRQSLLIKPA